MTYRHDGYNPNNDTNATISDKPQLPITQLNIGVLLKPDVFSILYSAEAATATSHKHVDSQERSPALLPLFCQVSPKWFDLTATIASQKADSDAGKSGISGDCSFRFRIYYAAVSKLMLHVGDSNGLPVSGEEWSPQLSLALTDVPLIWKSSGPTQHWYRSIDLWSPVLKSSTSGIGDCNLYQIRLEGHGARRLVSQLVESLVQAGATIDRERPLVSRKFDSFGEELNVDISALCEHVGLEYITRYYLETCLTNGIFHKCNINRAFLERLSKLPTASACTLLRTCYHFRQRIFDPESIFRQRSAIPIYKEFSNTIGLLRAVVKPTKISVQPPTQDISKRILRHFHAEAAQGRFILVDFTDESCAGHLASGAQTRHGYQNELFARVKRVVNQGFMIAGRKYVFLMATPVQMRRNTAWFVATTEGFSVNDILRSIGDVCHVRNTALYSSRLALWLSTTYPIPSRGIHLARIPDIERNGECFSDGVGKMSSDVMRTIAKKLELKEYHKSYSTVQFRLGGAKGILTVDPNLTGSTILLRGSQEKFAGPIQDIEINEVAQYRPAHLDMQLVPLLVALGVSDSTILGKVSKRVNELLNVTQDEAAASHTLDASVGITRKVQVFAKIIEAGFMTAREPFVISCLNLWQAWSLKDLKERFAFAIHQGATLFGCLDETGVLKGWSRDSASARPGNNEHLLPEVFVQITDETSPTGFMIIEGICAITRDPCLHPADVRVVRAVNKVQLHHTKNCIVFPQTGELPVPKMCANGDLDGDLYTVIWDPDLIPTSWNEPACDYDITISPAPDLDRPVTSQDMATFFSEFIQHKSAQEIVDTHHCWTDLLPDGIRSKECRELARLAHVAAGYVKHGQSVPMPDRYVVPVRPHWDKISGYVEQEKAYHSTSTLGRWFDMVPVIQFKPEQTSVFDQRTLTVSSKEEPVFRKVRALKDQYDLELRDFMETYGVSSEFELWTSWILSHNGLMKEFNLSYKLGNIMSHFEDRNRARCLAMAGVSSTHGSNWSKFAPFLRTMYTVTAAQVQHGSSVRSSRSAKNKVLISFPWLFPDELIRIAKESESTCIANTNEEDYPPTWAPKPRL